MDLTDLHDSMRFARSTVRLTVRVRVILGALIASFVGLGLSMLIGAGRWYSATNYLMIERIAPLRTWGLAAVLIAAIAAWGMLRHDVFACRVAFVVTAGYLATWSASMAASLIVGESQGMAGIFLTGLAAVWSIVLAGVPLTDPLREAAHGIVRAAQSNALGMAHDDRATAPADGRSARA